MNQKELKQRLIGLIDDSTEGHVENLCQPFGAESLADHLIANGVTIRERGEWKAFPDEHEICSTEFVCSNCNESFTTRELTDEQFLEMMKYCPNCGADMRGGKDE